MWLPEVCLSDRPMKIVFLALNPIERGAGAEFATRKNTVYIFSFFIGDCNPV